MNPFKDANDINAFWFEQLEPKQWFMGGKEVDDMIMARLGDIVDRALRAELFSWRATIEGRVAEIIVLDQFTRNCFRGTAKAFVGDPLAQILSQEVAAHPQFDQLKGPRKLFAVMPLMHAESSVIHRNYRDLFQPDQADSLKFFDDHAEVVARFGRYPSRNKAMGRESTPEELEYLKDGHSWGQ